MNFTYAYIIFLLLSKGIGE